MKRKLGLIMVAAGIMFTACQNDEDGVSVVNGEQGTPVKFELDASVLNYNPSNPSLRYSPQYTPSGFSIYAFREQTPGAEDYSFEKNVNLANMAYDPTDKKLKGTDALNIGRYKFIAAYGLNQPVLDLASWGALNDNYSITYNPDDVSNPANNRLGEIFLPEGNSAGLRNYDLGLSAQQNETVEIALKRAVARVDIMFFKGQKNSDGTYTELAYSPGNHVFGGQTLDYIQLRYQTLNNVIGYFGEYRTTNPIPQANINLTGFYGTNGTMTIGNNNTGTIVGNQDYTRYDDVQAGDMIYGAAHIFGNYLLPNTDDTKTTSLEVYVKPVNGIARTINVSYDDDHKLPIEKNKVTLVKIYVIDNGNGGGGDPGDPELPHVFSTNVRFEVEIDTVWEDSYEVTGELN